MSACADNLPGRDWFEDADRRKKVLREHLKNGLREDSSLRLRLSEQNLALSHSLLYEQARRAQLSSENMKLKADLRAMLREQEQRDEQEKAVAVMMKSTLEQLEKSHMEIVVATKRELASVREERGALVARLKSGEALVLEVQQHLELASLDLEESFAGVKVDFDDVERGTRAMEVHKMALQERVAALSGAVHSNLNGACQELELVREETEALLETIKVVRAEMREEKCVAELRLKEQEDSLNAHRRWGATRGQQIQRCDSEIKELQRQLIIVSWGRDEAVGARRAAEAARDAAVAECTAVTAEVDAWKEKLCVCKAGAQMLRAQLQLEGPPEEEGSLSLSLSFLSSLWQTELERGHGAQEHAAGEPEESVQGAVEELEVEVEEAKGWRRVLQERLREAA